MVMPRGKMPSRPGRHQPVADLDVGQVRDELAARAAAHPRDPADDDAADARALDDRAGAGVAVDEELDLGGVERRRLDDPADDAGGRDDRHVLAQAARRPLVDGHRPEDADGVARDDVAPPSSAAASAARSSSSCSSCAARSARACCSSSLHPRRASCLPQLLVLLTGPAQADVAVPDRPDAAEDPGGAELDLREHPEGDRLEHAGPRATCAPAPK